MSRPSKHHNKPLSKLRRPSPGAPAQEAVGLLTQPDSLADARGCRPRKNSRSTVPGVEADACGTAPRKKPRSALPGVEADARGTAPWKSPRSALPGVDADARSHRPRKNSRPVGRGRRPRGRRPNRRRSLSHVSPSLPLLSHDSPDIEGEIALLRSLTNRLLSMRPLDYTQINRCLRLIIRAWSAQAKAPKQLTDEEQIDNLIKKVFQDNVDRGDLDFRDLVPVRMARPGDKWWPWRHLIPIHNRWRFGLIDPDEPWPPEEDEWPADEQAMRRFAGTYIPPDFLDDLEEDDDEDDDYDPDPDDDNDPPPYYPPHDEDPDPLSVVPAEAGTHPPMPTEAGLYPSPLDPFEEHPPDLTITPNPPPNPKPLIARGRPPP